MATLLQDINGDISLVNGQTTLVTDPVQEGCINLANRFKMFLGEWFRDTREGVPWVTQILAIKNPSIPVLQNIFRQVIIGCPPFVDAIVTVTAPDARRSATCSFVAFVDPAVAAGVTVTAASLDEPFIINLPGAQ